ncbi:MAG: hypothetical protein L0211_06205 [Planctomycetaceae bacterium]|nr:hypothetical protein [Planctomycetaceae bacterium]
MLTSTFQNLMWCFALVTSRRMVAQVACGAMLALTLAAAPQHAMAETPIYQASFDDGTFLNVYYDADFDQFYWEHFDSDGNTLEVGFINPSPDGPDEAPGDFGSRLALLKQKGGGGLSGPAVEQTPLGTLLTSKGKGIGPLHNPSGDSPGGQSPSSIEFASPQKEFEEFWAGAGYPLGPGFDGNGGSLGGQIKDGLKHGKKKGGGGDGGDSKPSDGGLWDDAMPGPPELVNPAWRKNSFTLMGPLMGAGSGGSMKGLRTAPAGGLTGMSHLNLGSSIRSKQVGGATMALRTTGGLAGGARAMTGLKLSK